MCYNSVYENGPRINHGMAAKADRVGIFLHADLGFASAQLRTKTTHACNALARVLGADSSTRSCRSVAESGVRHSMGTRRDRRHAALPHLNFAFSGAVN